jgi:hypothetical protein
MMLCTRQIKRMIKAQRGTICHIFTLTSMRPIMVARSTLRFFISTLASPFLASQIVPRARSLCERAKGRWRPTRNFFNLRGSRRWRCPLRGTQARVESPSNIPPTTLVGDGFGAIGEAPAALPVLSPMVMAIIAGMSANVAACHISPILGSPSSCCPPPRDVDPTSRIFTIVGEVVSGICVSSEARATPLVPVRTSSLVGTAVPVLPRPQMTSKGCRTSYDSVL